MSASSSCVAYWRCTYSAQLAKKHKTFVDGFVRLSCGGCKLTLLAASGAGGGSRELESAVRSAPFALRPDDELLLDGHIVRIDEPALRPDGDASGGSTVAVTQSAGTGSGNSALPARATRLPRRSSFRPPARIAPLAPRAASSSRDTALTSSAAPPRHTAAAAARPRAEPAWEGGIVACSSRGSAADSKPLQPPHHRQTQWRTERMDDRVSDSAHCVDLDVDVFALLSGSPLLGSTATEIAALRLDKQQASTKDAKKHNRADHVSPTGCSPITSHSGSPRCDRDPSSPTVTTATATAITASHLLVSPRSIGVRVSSDTTDDLGDVRLLLSANETLANSVNEEANKENQPLAPRTNTDTVPPSRKALSFNAVPVARSACQSATSASRAAAAPLPAPHPVRAFAFLTTEWKPQAASAVDTPLAIARSTHRPLGAPSPSLSSPPHSRPAPGSVSCTLRFLLRRSPAPSRSLSIPDVFDSAAHYQHTFVAALSEQINHALAHVASRFVAATKRRRAVSSQPIPLEHHTAGASHSNHAATAYPATATRQQRDDEAQLAYRSAGLHYYQQRALQIRRAGKPTKRTKPTHPQKMTRLKQETRKQRSRRRTARGFTRDDENNDEDEADEDSETEADAKATATAADDGIHLWLTLADLAAKEKGAVYRRDDLWLLSNDPLFGWQQQQHDEAQRPRSTRYDAPWVMFVVSEFRSFADKHGHMRVSLLAVEGATMHTLPINLSKPINVYGIRALALGNEMPMLRAIQSLSASSLPLLPCLLRGAGVSAAELSIHSNFPSRIAELRIPSSLLSTTRSAVIDEFSLNDDQTAVLDHCIAWLQPPASSSSSQSGASPVVLVHGTFGGGKTTLLVALIVYLHRVLSVVDRQNNVRVLVACLTNVAVDGILSALLRRSQDCFARVGSSRRIAANVLRHTLLDPSGGKGVEETHQQAIVELKKQIDERRDTARRLSRQHQPHQQHDGEREAEGAEDDSVELRDMEAALAEMKAERGQDRKRRLLAKRVVAVTCAASSFDILNECEFPIVLLDECSQMIEPASLLPMQRFRCQRLVAVGDPQQLAPQISDVEAVGTVTNFASQSIASTDRAVTVASCLAKPLFERLCNAGLPTVLLRHQYRMHPTLAHMPNLLFYNGQLRDGVVAEDRPALLRRADDHSRALGPLTFVNVPRGQEVRATAPYSPARDGEDSSGSTSWRNDSEVRVVVLTVTALLQRGIPPSSIAVITLYKPQWTNLKAAIANLMTLRDAQLSEQQSVSGQQRPQTEPARLASGVSVVGSELSVRYGAAASECAAGGSAFRRAVVRADGVQVNTVDSFQGGEKDIVILSTVRTSPSDFLDNPKRVNVALTRARHHLILVGHHATLLHSTIWKPVVNFIASSCPGCYFPSGDLFVDSLSRSMEAVQLAVRVSQKDGAASMQPSQACSAAGRRTGGRGGARKRTLADSAARRTEADDDAERAIEDEPTSSAPATPRSGIQAVVTPAHGREPQEVTTADSAMAAAEWLKDDEDAPLPLLTHFTAATDGRKQSQPLHVTAPQPSEGHSSTSHGQHERTERKHGSQTLAAAEQQADDGGAERLADSAVEGQRHTECERDRVTVLTGAPTAPPPPVGQPAALTAAGWDEASPSSADQVDEEGVVVRQRHVKRARLLSDDDEPHGDCDDQQPTRAIERRNLQPQPHPHRLHSAAEQSDAFDFDWYEQQQQQQQQQQQLRGEPWSGADVAAGDVDMLSLLRSEEARNRAATERAQRVARIEAEQSLTEAALREHKMQRLRRERRAQM